MANIKKALRDFWYGKPHSAEEGGRRLGDLYDDKTGLLKHREWRGVKDTEVTERYLRAYSSRREARTGRRAASLP